MTVVPARRFPLFVAMAHAMVMKTVIPVTPTVEIASALLKGSAASHSAVGNMRSATTGIAPFPITITLKAVIR
jgi:hypothetical protein